MAYAPPLLPVPSTPSATPSTPYFVGPQGPAGPVGPVGATGTVAAAGPGTALLPSITFAADTNTGLYNPAADTLGISVGGVGTLFVSPNLVEQRDGTTSQQFRIYNSYTDASNYSRLSIYTNAGPNTYIAQDTAGTGMAGQLIFDKWTGVYVRVGVTGWYFTPNLQTESDNTIDIGTSGNYRPRDVWVARDVHVGRSLIAIDAQIAGSLLLSGSLSIVLGITTGPGDQTTPAYSFGNDTNTGIFRSAVDSLGVTNGGVHTWVFGNDGTFAAMTDNAYDIGTALNRSRKIYTGALAVSAVPAFAAGDKYLVVDASGNVHRSAIGPAS